LKRRTTNGKISFAFSLLFRVSPTISFKKQFSTYLADGIGSEDIEEIYTNAHAAIREDPTFKPTDKTKDWRAECKKYSTPRLTLEQRKARIQTKIEAFKAGGGAEDENEEEDDDE